VFVGQFRCGFAAFFGEEKPFPVDRTDLKIIARWCHDWCSNVRENFSKSEKTGAKFVCTTLAIYKQDERKILPYHFTLYIVDVHPNKNYFASSLQGATKNCKS